ncbi:MAG: hypothetical protein J6U80_07740 [Bacteroidales bacterium]|nr:hypothetical protein [Bacteroidales bacterium]
MKRVFVSLIALMAALVSVSGQNSDMFFSVTKGDSFTYTIRNAEGEVEYKYTYSNKEVNGADLSDASVLYGYQFWKGDGTPLFADNGMMDMKITLNSEGTTSYMYDMKKSMAIQDVVTMGDVSSLPSDLKVGQSVPDGKINIKVKSVGASFLLTERKVLSEEVVNTPAGTFNTYKMDEHQTNKVLVSTKTFHIITWYAKNIGCIKQEVYDKKGKLLRTLELTALVQK